MEENITTENAEIEVNVMDFFKLKPLQPPKPEEPTKLDNKELI